MIILQHYSYINFPLHGRGIYRCTLVQSIIVRERYLTLYSRTICCCTGVQFTVERERYRKDGGCSVELLGAGRSLMHPVLGGYSVVFSNKSL